MEKTIITFTADEQRLVKTDGIDNYASNTVDYVEAQFELGDNWTGYDVIRAVWHNGSACISTALGNGVCIVPTEVLAVKGTVTVNLVGSITENNVLTDRLTTYPIVALRVVAEARICGDNTQPVTPSEFEQFVAIVKADADRAEAGADSAEASAESAETFAGQAGASATEAGTYAQSAQTYAQNAEISATDAENAKEDAENARDEIRAMRATANTLPAGSDATASYADGLLTLGIPRGDKGAKGDKGDTGATPNLSIGTVETLPPTGQSQVTITGTAENPVLNFKLVKGDTGEVTMAQLAQLLPTDTASGDIASWTDGTDVFPAVSVLTTIDPIQSGSGTPSPTNIRPISGHTECVTSVCGVNVWDEEWERTVINWTTFKFTPSATGGRLASKNYIRVEPNQVYYANFDTANTVLCGYSDNEGNNGRSIAVTASTHLFTVPSDCHYLKFGVNTTNYGTVYKNDMSINYPSTNTGYHAYAGHTYTTTLGRTVYGGTLDVVSGVLTVTDANIASYNGETLPSTWISDRDVYASGTTPTTGAQVVYKLSTPQTYQLDPQTVQTLLGTNNVWTDCGEVEVTYKADTYLWVEKKLS